MSYNPVPVLIITAKPKVYNREQVEQLSKYLVKQILCETMSGNPVPVLTITAKPKVYNREQVEQLSKFIV